MSETDNSTTGIPLVNIAKRGFQYSRSKSAGYTRIPEEGGSIGNGNGGTNFNEEGNSDSNTGREERDREDDGSTNGYRRQGNGMASTVVAATASFRAGKGKKRSRDAEYGGDVRGKGKARYVDEEDDEQRTLLGEREEEYSEERRSVERSRVSRSQSVSDFSFLDVGQLFLY